jgi:hypothetical protein
MARYSARFLGPTPPVGTNRTSPNGAASAAIAAAPPEVPAGTSGGEELDRGDAELELDLRGRRNFTPDPRRRERPGQPEPGRTRLVDRSRRPRQRPDPVDDLFVAGRQPRPEHLTSDAIDRRCDDRSCVHIQTNTRTLGKHRGLPHTGASHTCRHCRTGACSVTHETV